MYKIIPAMRAGLEMIPMCGSGETKEKFQHTPHQWPGNGQS
jgi:hypothetical protein